MLKPRSFAMAFLVAILSASSVLAQATAKPVAIVGSSYGTYEVKSVITNALTVSKELEYSFVNCGGALPVSDLDKYSLVIVATAVSKPITAEENKLIDAYLRKGGHLLIINRPTNSMAKTIGFKDLTWMGAQYTFWARKGFACKVLKPDHPLLKGAFEKYKNPAWLKGSIMASVKPGGMENIIGGDNGQCLVGMNRVGKGWVVFMGHELFRLKPLKNKDTVGWIQILRNVIAAAQPLTTAMMREQALGSSELQGKKLLVWDREWTMGERYGPRFSPPMPAAKELITTLSADMAVDEYESLQLNLTPTVEVGDASWEIAPGKFPRANLEFFVQDRPDPIPWPKDPKIAVEAPYWLLPPEHVAPKGRPEFAVPAKQTRVVWLRLNTAGVAPGEYELALNFNFAKGLELSVPVNVKVYPVRVPRRRLITLKAGGQIYGDAIRPAPALRFAKDLESHGVEWSLINVVRATSVRPVGEKTNLVGGYFVNNRERLEKGDFPALDFSDFDPWMEQAIGHGLTSFFLGRIDRYFVRSIKQSGLTPEGQDRTHEWMGRELARYLQEKGVRTMVLSSGDELSEKEIREHFIPWAAKMIKAGWGCSSSFTGRKHRDPKLNAELYPYVKLWTLNRVLAQEFVADVRNGRLKVRDDAIIGTYGAGAGRGTEHRKALSESRFLGWESWRFGIQNCSPNPYFKSWLYYTKSKTRDLGIGGERWVSFIKSNDLSAPLADCPFLEGIRDGMEEGNLCAILAFYLDRIEQKGGAAGQRARTMRARLQSIIGQGPEAILKTKTVTAGGLQMALIDASNQDFRRAKRAVLEMLAAVRKDAFAVTRPTLYWNDIPLIREGRAVSAIHAGTLSADKLSDRIRELVGVSVPAAGATLDPQSEVAVVIGNTSQNPLAATLAREHGIANANVNYPGKGSYFIKEFTRGKQEQRILWIAGPDDEGTRKGVKMFTQFLRGELNWLLQ